MRHRRSGGAAQGWQQLDLMGDVPGVGARHGHGHSTAGGGGYRNGCTPTEVAHGARKKIAKISRFAPVGEFGARQLDDREKALLAELDAMGLSRVLLQVAHAIGFDAFMVAWRILDAAPETWTDSESGIQLRMPRLTTYKRYQRNRFIEAMAAIGMTQPEIARAVARDLGEKVSDRHIWRLMAAGRVKA